MALTDIETKRAKAGEKAYKVSDGGGLYLWVTPTGGKLWRWDYRAGGKQKTMALGRYPEVTLLEARARHLSGRKLLASGVDPMEERRTRKTEARAADENSFASVGGRWLAHWSEGKSARHVDTTRRRLEANILPALGERPVAEIEAPELVAMVKVIEQRGARDIAKTRPGDDRPDIRLCHCARARQAESGERDTPGGCFAAYTQGQLCAH